MQISGKPTQPEINEAARMMRSNLSWTQLLARQAYAIVVAGIVIWDLVRIFTSGHAVDWHNVGIRLVVLAVILVFIGIRMQRITGRTKAATIQNFPDTLTLGTSGIQTQSSNGASSSVPWTAFKSWRLGSKIILLNYTEGKRYMILPLASMPPTQQENLRGTVQSYLGPAGKRR